MKPLKLIPWLIAGSLAWTLGYVYNIYYAGELSWLRRMYEEKVAIAAQVQAPNRLIIAGGSGAHFTINSELIEEGVDMPVINLGLDGPVGLNIILPTILEQVRPGDIVLLIPEYMLLLDEDGIGDRSVGFAFAIGKPGIGDVPLKQLAQDAWSLGVPSLRSLSESTMDLVEEGKVSGYYGPVTEHGDPQFTNTRTGKWWKMNIDNTISPHALNKITQFREDVEAKGGHLVLSLPWVYAKTDEKTRNNVLKTASKLEKIAPLLYDTESLNLQTDSSLFADTHYHILPEARKLRAEELVTQLQPVIEEIKLNEQ